MKKNLWIWALAAFSMAACTSEDVPTQQQVTEDDWISPDGQVVVQLGAESSPTITVSRANPTGIIEGDDIIKLDDIGIFALNRNATFSSTDITGWQNSTNCLLMNVKAKGTDKNPLDYGTGLNEGKRLTLYKPDAQTSGAVYYYPIQGKQHFDFYGYFPRTDATVDISNDKMRVKVNIGGNVDLITGEAPQATPVKETELYVSETPAKGTDATDIHGYNAKYIRKIKYHNWIIDKDNSLQTSEKKPFIPNIQFKHRLTKLNFQIITAKEQSGDDLDPETNPENNQENDRESAKKLRVNTIQVVNAYQAAYLTIGKDMPLSFEDSDRTNLNMIKVDNNTIWENNNIIPQVYKEVDQEEENPTYISAGYIMVPATEDIANYANNPYKISMTIVANEPNGEPETQNVVLDLPANTIFEAGHSYNIRIALYAQQKVHISATLTEWVDVDAPIEIPVY